MRSWGQLAKLTPQELRELQNKRLHAFLNEYLYPFSPHYKKLLDDNKIDPRKIRTVEDLKHIPLTTKKDFVDPNNPKKIKDFIQQPDPEKIKKAWPLPKLLKLKGTAILKGKDHVKEQLGREFRPIFITFTTGTTQLPVSFFYSNYDIKNLYVSGSRMLELFQTKESEFVVNMFPYAPHLGIWQVVFGGLSSCVLIVSTGGGKTVGTEGNIRAIEKIKPSVILGVPSYVYHVLRVAKEKGYKFDTIKTVILGAARVTIGFKQKVVELLESMGASGISVIGTYGFTEARCAWGEFPTKDVALSSGYCLYPDKEIFEIIDPKTGEVKGEGEDGEIVYTSIDSRASSMLRYRTGDFARGGIIYSPCKYSGLSVPRLSTDITRISDTQDMHLTKVKGALVNFNNFFATLSDIPEVEEWQLEISKKNDDPYEVDQITVYLTAKDGVNQAKLVEDVTNKLQVNTEVSPNAVKFLPLDEMIKRIELETANKDRRVVDRRPKE